MSHPLESVIAVNPFDYGEMLLKRHPKDRNEFQAMKEILDATETRDRESLERVTVEHREELIAELAEVLRVSNTQFPNSNSPLKTCLENDEKLFDQLPLGGGGIDWLNVSICHGVIGQAGWELRNEFIRARDEARANGEKKAIVHVEGVEMPFIVHNKAIGEGATKQPLLVHWNGLAIRYGKVQESYPKTGGFMGGIGVIECPGLTCLRLGESGMCKLMRTLCDLLGIQVNRCRATRLDACADLPECDIEHFGKMVEREDYVTRATKVDTHRVRGKFTGVTARTKAITLRVYEKVVELCESEDQEKLALMIQNRWGFMPQKAVRVEYQFSLSHLSAMSFLSLEELFEGLGVLLEWACNDWFRLAEVKSRSNTTRAPVARVWLRAVHAFTYWAGRFNIRREARPISPAAPARMAAQMRGLMSSVLVRSGIRVSENGKGLKGPKGFVVEEMTGFDVLARYMSVQELLAQVKDVGDKWDAARGTSSEDEDDWIPTCECCGVILPEQRQFLRNCLGCEVSLEHPDF